MRDPSEPKNKRERKWRNYCLAAKHGRFPWTASGIEECVVHLTRTFASLSNEEQDDWSPYIASMRFIREKYGENRGTVHTIRMAQIIAFMCRHRKKMIQDGLMRQDEDGTQWWAGHLAEGFARLRYSSSGFRYADVKKYVQACKKPS